MSCLYCGWEPNREGAAYGAVVHETSFVQAARLWRFAFASLLFVPLSVVLFGSGMAHSDVAAFAFAGLALVPGPVAFAMQLLRRSQGDVETTQEGVRVGDVLVRWSEVTSVDELGYVGSGGAIDGFAKAFSAGGATGKFVGTMLGTRHVLGLVFLPVLFALEVVVPAFVLISPWRPRVELRRTRGDALVLCDLDDPVGFARTAVAATQGPGARRRLRRRAA